MKKWYLFAVLVIFIGCNDEENEQEFREISIEKSYPYIYEKHSMNDVEANVFELFNQKIFLINSITELNKNPLFIYSPNILKEELSKCDFDKYSLVITSSSAIHEIVYLKYNFYYNNFYSEYEYNQTYYSKSLEEPIENIYLLINAFSVRKIPTDSKLVFTKASIII